MADTPEDPDAREDDEPKFDVREMLPTSPDAAFKVGEQEFPVRLITWDLLLTRGLDYTPDMQRALLVAAVEWLTEKWGPNRACPYCEVAQWEVGTPSVLRLGGEQYMSPAFPVMCGNCGHTVFINAIRAKLVPEPEPRALDDEAGDE